MSNLDGNLSPLQLIALCELFVAEYADTEAALAVGEFADAEPCSCAPCQLYRALIGELGSVVH